jgi:hypothetical protein
MAYIHLSITYEIFLTGIYSLLFLSFCVSKIFCDVTHDFKGNRLPLAISPAHNLYPHKISRLGPPLFKCWLLILT